MISVVIAFELYLRIRFVPWYFFLVAAKAFRFIRPVGYISGSLLCLLCSTTTLTFNLWSDLNFLASQYICLCHSLGLRQPWVQIALLVKCVLSNTASRRRPLIVPDIL